MFQPSTLEVTTKIFLKDLFRHAERKFRSSTSHFSSSATGKSKFQIGIVNAIGLVDDPVNFPESILKLFKDKAGA